MKLHGTVSEFDAQSRIGAISDLSGNLHRIEPGSFRRTVKLEQGAEVQFNSFNLFAGPTARDIEPDSFLRERLWLHKEEKT